MVPARWACWATCSEPRWRACELELLTHLQHVVVVNPDEAFRAGLGPGGAQAAKGRVHTGKLARAGIQLLVVHNLLFNLGKYPLT